MPSKLLTGRNADEEAQMAATRHLGICFSFFLLFLFRLCLLTVLYFLGLKNDMTEDAWR
jgi:hypothetical protein